MSEEIIDGRLDKMNTGQLVTDTEAWVARAEINLNAIKVRLQKIRAIWEAEER